VPEVLLQVFEAGASLDLTWSRMGHPGFSGFFFRGYFFVDLTLRYGYYRSPVEHLFQHTAIQRGCAGRRLAQQASFPPTSAESGLPPANTNGRRLRRVVTMLLAMASMGALLGPPASRANLVTYSLSGTVGVAADHSGLAYVPSAILNGGLPVVGTVSFENSVAPSSITSTSASYRGNALNLSVTFTIDGLYTYSLTTPSTQDEIDISTFFPQSTRFSIFKRGPTVYTGFEPYPPFSHFEFSGYDGVRSLQLSDAVITGSNPFGANGLSDQQTEAGYYYIGLSFDTVQPVPEPGSLWILGVACLGLLHLRKNKRS
jgi:hypothetical protein